MGSPYDALNSGRGYIAPGSSGWDSSVPGYGLEGVLSQYNVSPMQYQEWAQLTSGMTSQQLSDIAAHTPGKAPVNNGQYSTYGGEAYTGSNGAGGVISSPGFYPTNYTGSGGGQLYDGTQSYQQPAGTPIATRFGYDDSPLSHWYSGIPTDIAGLPGWQAQDIYGAQANLSLVGQYAKQAQAAQAQKQAAAQQQAQTSAPGPSAGYTPTTQPGVNPITGSPMVGGNAPPGLYLPANQASNANAQGVINAAGSTAGGSAQGVLQQYADLYAQGLSSVGQYGQAELGQLQNAYLQNSAQQQQGLQSRGLGNTTVSNAVQSGLAQSQNLALSNLNENIGKYQTDVIGSLGTNVANAASGIYSQQAGINAQMQQQAAQINAAAQQQQQQIAAQSLQQANQFNYATALAAQQFGYNSNLQQQQVGLQSKYQQQLLQMQLANQSMSHPSVVYNEGHTNMGL